MKWSTIVVFLCLFVLGCQQSNFLECNEMQVAIAGKCCQDNDGNSLCDDIELTDYELKLDGAPEKKEQKAIKKYINLTELQEKINETFYPLYSYSFNFSNRSNITGLKSTYDIFKAKPYDFDILKIKKPYNYQHTEKNFTNFVQKNNELIVREFKMLVAKEIDWGRMDYEKWENAYSVYEPELEKQMISGKPTFFQIHNFHIGIRGELQKSGVYFSLTIPCTPELMVRIFSIGTWFVPYYTGSQVETNKQRFKEFVFKAKPNMTEAAERILAICNGDFKPINWENNEVVFLGRDGFRPPEIAMQVDEPLIIHNHNDEWLGLAFLLERRVNQRVKTFDTEQIIFRQAGRVKFEEPGNYTLFSEQFNPRGKVIVTK